ncbi:ADP-ribosylation factor-like protein 2-binding protein [Allomyces arbusculus]|nr:ADP-ribosylation factor-like protein 2-binding protein [Allomyces arbusculus]
MATTASSTASLDRASSGETLESCENATSLRFDLVISEMENILLDPAFRALQDQFYEKYYHEFEDRDENKLICMDIFKEYVHLVENFLERRLSSALPWFNMPEFVALCRNSVRPDSTDGDVFDIMASLADFNTFKEFILAYRKEREGTALDFSDLILTTALHH